MGPVPPESPFLRYDDRLETLMNARTRDAGARAAMWVQLVDVLAQDRGNYPPELKANAYRWLEKWRAEVPERRRVGAAAAISGRPVPNDLVDFFARDAAPVARPVLMRCPPQESAWAEKLPAWPASSRAILAERRDLPPGLARDLESLGPQTLALPAASPIRFEAAREEDVVAIAPAQMIPFASDDILDLPLSAIVTTREAEAEPGVSPVKLPAEQPAQPAAEVKGEEGPVAPINELLARIERYRKDHPHGTPSVRAASGPVRAFVYETDRNGALNWVEGAPRGALIGLSLADMALPGESGVDGQAAGAFRKRARFDHARMLVGGHGGAAGDWLISGEPVFEVESGRFLGYQGQARRLTDDRAEEQNEALIGGALRPASVRQLVHELRTPLNAIRGFAEMIEGEFLGPVADPYRARASAIVKDSQRLLRVFEDLDSAARLESGDYPVAEDARINLTGLVRETFAQAAPMAADRHIALRVSLPETEIEAALDEPSSMQLLGGFVELIAGVAHAGETVDVSLLRQPGTVVLAAAPAASSLVERWDWAATVPDGPARHADILPLGLGYKFRLLSRLAARVGGSLAGASDRLTLILPVPAARDERSIQG